MNMQCPVCERDNTVIIFPIKDFSISKEVFHIAECKTCSLRFTADAPAADKIGPYYQSTDYISHSETKAGLVSKLYHRVRKITLRGKLKLINNTVGRSAGKLLDIGSGTGAFAAFMRENSWYVIGLEPDPGARATAKQLYNIDLLPVDQISSLQPESFDAITLWHVLEHVHELKPRLRSIRKLLTKDGYAFIAVPNYTSYDAQHYKEHWAAYDVPRHLYHFSPKSMRILLEAEGFSLQEIKPMWYDSYYVSMLSEKYKTGKSNLLKAFAMGYKSNLKAKQNIEKGSSLIYIVCRDNNKTQSH